MSTDKLEKAEKIVGRGNHPFMMLFGPIEHVGNYTIFNRACFTSNMQSLKPNDRVVFKNDNVEYLLVIIAQQLSSNQLWLYVLAPNSSTLFRMRASLIDKVLPPIASQENTERMKKATETFHMETDAAKVEYTTRLKRREVSDIESQQKRIKQEPKSEAPSAMSGTSLPTPSAEGNALPSLTSLPLPPPTLQNYPISCLPVFPKANHCSHMSLFNIMTLNQHQMAQMFHIQTLNFKEWKDVLESSPEMREAMISDVRWPLLLQQIHTLCSLEMNHWAEIQQFFDNLPKKV